MESLARTANRGSVSTGYDIDNSAAFGGANGIQFNPSSDGNRRTWTVSLWLKRSELSTETTIFGSQNTVMVLMDPDWFRFSLYTGSATYYFDTENSGPVYRDTSAWYNFVFQCDTTQGTASDRAKLWVNGESVTNTNSNTIPQNAEFDLNDNTKNIQVGYFYAGNEQLDGYLSEIHFTDGVANDADAFGEYDNDSGIWKPKAYAGSYGTNGFYLEFKESAASATGIGKDTSGNGHNFSTGGTYPSQATDTPTNNFCTLNPVIPYSVQSGTPAISLGATAHNGSGGWTGMKGTIGVNKGKWYWELSTNSGTGAELIHGIQTVNSASGESTATSAHNLLETAAWYVNGGHWIKDETSGRDDIAAGSITQTYGNSVIHAVALNMDDGEITYYANGSVVSGLNQVDLDGLDGEIVSPFASVYNQAVEWNFGGYTNISISSSATDANGYGTFEYAPPSGYYALCTKNLAEFG